MADGRYSMTQDEEDDHADRQEDHGRTQEEVRSACMMYAEEVFEAFEAGWVDAEKEKILADRLIGGKLVNAGKETREEETGEKVPSYPRLNKRSGRKEVEQEEGDEDERTRRDDNSIKDEDADSVDWGDGEEDKVIQG